jgi:hypothetical protein
VEAGEEVKCIFTNTKRGKILVDKVTVPSGVTQQFEFDPSWSGTNFFLTDADSPEDSGYLLPGNYSVEEVNIPTGWSLTNSWCETVEGSGTSADNPASITLEPGETVKCTFENIGRGNLEVIKIVEWAGTPDESQTFEICIQGPSYPDGDCQIIGYNGGTLIWQDLIIGNYTVTETNPGVTWKVSIEPDTVTVPGNDTATVTVTNRKTYLAYTPGFWKNHWGNPELGNDHDAWQYTDYSTTDLLCDIFSNAADYVEYMETALLNALSLRGGPGDDGAAEILLRAGVAALLNASLTENGVGPADGFVPFPYETAAEVIEDVDVALVSGREAMLTLAGELDAYNNGGSDYFNWDW